MIVVVKQLNLICQYIIVSKTVNPMISENTDIKFTKVDNRQNMFLIEATREDKDITFTILDDYIYTLIIPRKNKELVLTINEDSSQIIAYSAINDKDTPFALEILVNTLSITEMRETAKKCTFPVYIMVMSPSASVVIDQFRITVDALDKQRRGIQSSKYGYDILSNSKLFTFSDKDETSFDKFFSFSTYDFNVKTITQTFQIDKICGI